MCKLGIITNAFTVIYSNSMAEYSKYILRKSKNQIVCCIYSMIKVDKLLALVIFISEIKYNLS